MTTLTFAPHAPQGFFPFNSAFSAVKTMIETRKQRHALEMLDSAAMADIGLTYAQAKAEFTRKFWDIQARDTPNPNNFRAIQRNITDTP